MANDDREAIIDWKKMEGERKKNRFVGVSNTVNSVMSLTLYQLSHGSSECLGQIDIPYVGLASIC